MERSNYARTRGRRKRGGDLERVTLDGILDGLETPDVDALVVDEAMQRLAAVSERKCRVVELRIFGGMTVEETAKAMGIGERMVKRDWQFACAWLKRDLGLGETSGEGGINPTS